MALTTLTCSIYYSKFANRIGFQLHARCHARLTSLESDRLLYLLMLQFSLMQQIDVSVSPHPMHARSDRMLTAFFYAVVGALLADHRIRRLAAGGHRATDVDPTQTYSISIASILRVRNGRHHLCRIITLLSCKYARPALAFGRARKTCGPIPTTAAVVLIFVGIERAKAVSGVWRLQWVVGAECRLDGVAVVRCDRAKALGWVGKSQWAVKVECILTGIAGRVTCYPVKLRWRDGIISERIRAWIESYVAFSLAGLGCGVREYVHAQQRIRSLI